MRGVASLLLSAATVDRQDKNVSKEETSIPLLA